MVEDPSDEPRRRWTVEQKHRIVEETFGASVSVVARRYDINANVLFKGKREAEAPQLRPDGAPTLLASMPGEGNRLRPSEPVSRA